jgi:hypothetical protein
MRLQNGGISRGSDDDPGNSLVSKVKAKMHVIHNLIIFCIQQQFCCGRGMAH